MRTQIIPRLGVTWADRHRLSSRHGWTLEWVCGYLCIMSCYTALMYQEATVHVDSVNMSQFVSGHWYCIASLCLESFIPHTLIRPLSGDIKHYSYLFECLLGAHSYNVSSSMNYNTCRFIWYSSIYSCLTFCNWHNIAIWHKISALPCEINT